MKKVKKEHLYLHLQNQLNDTQADMQFISSIIYSFLQSKEGMDACDVAGVDTLCCKLNKKLSKCEKSLAKLHKMCA